MKKKEKRQQVCVILQTAGKRTPMSKSTDSQQHNGEITPKLPGRQQTGSCQTLRSSPPRELIRAEAHPGTLSPALECTRFPTLIPSKPLQLM